MSQAAPLSNQRQEHPDDFGPGLLEAVWRFRWLVAAAAILAALVAFGASFLQPPMYEAEARLLLADPRAASAFGESSGLVVGDGARFVRNQAEYVGSTPVMLRASELLEGEMSPSRLAERTTVQASADLDLITIRVLAPTAQLAADATNAVGQAYQDVRAEEIQTRAHARIAELEESREEVRQRLDAAESTLDAAPDNATARAERDAMAAQLVTLDNRISQLSTDASLYGSGVELFEQATTPRAPAQPRPARNAAAAAVLGILAASAYSWWRAERTMSADDPADPAPRLRAPLLGKVPDFEDLGIQDVAPAQSAPRSPAGEAYQFIIATLETLQGAQGPRSLLVTSAGAADGKTVTVLNLAIAAIRDGRGVLLVDADERARGLTRMAEVEPSPGLADLGDPDMPLQHCIAEWHIAEFTVPFVPAGKELTDPAATYRSAPFRRGVQRLRDAADLVLVDSPPILAVADTIAIAGQFDGIILVVDRGTPLRVLAEVRDRLDLVGVPIIGYVFNRAARSRDARYGYGYRYGHGHEQRADAAPAGTGNGKPPARRRRLRLARR